MSTHPQVLSAIIPKLQCPFCGADVALESDSVTCAHNHELMFRDGYLDASVEQSSGETRRTFESFGYEWTRFDRVQPEDEIFWSRYFDIVPLRNNRPQLALDAGCGKGRYSLFTARHVEKLVALDGSEAVPAAARNLETSQNVLVVKSDLRHAPFKDETFDLISCLGVLHHLETPRSGFEKLVQFLAPGGLLHLYVYSRPEGRNLRSIALTGASALRRITTRVSHRYLYWLTVPIAAALYLLFVIPGNLGSRFGIGPLASLPLGTYRNKPFRALWLDTFDRLSAPIEHRYTRSEIIGWFDDVGMEVVACQESAELPGIVIVGKKEM